MIWLSAALASCDPEALTALADSMPEEPDISYVATGLRAACTRPYAWREALKHPDDLALDLQVAIRQASAWERACPGGMFALPSGITSPSAGARLDLYTRCEFPSNLANPEEFISAPGPVISAVIANQVLHLAPLETRQALVRGLLGLPKHPEVLPEIDDPFAGFRANAKPRIVKLAKVKWPPGVELNMVCTAKIRVLKEGSPQHIKWIDCPQLVRGNVESAILASWFEPGRRNHQPKPGTLTLTFRPKQEVQQLHPQLPSAPSPPKSEVEALPGEATYHSGSPDRD